LASGIEAVQTFNEVASILRQRLCGSDETRQDVIATIVSNFTKHLLAIIQKVAKIAGYGLPLDQTP
jgi:predicted butyrate kinase (DUF1464 family)